MSFQGHDNGARQNQLEAPHLKWLSQQLEGGLELCLGPLGLASLDWLPGLLLPPPLAVPEPFLDPLLFLLFLGLGLSAATSPVASMSVLTTAATGALRSVDLVER